MNPTLAQKLRLRFEVAYDGSAFHGWARQPGLRTVQGTLEDALATVMREAVSLTVAGRTDAGVHARRNVVHCDVSDAAFARLPGRSQRTPEEALMRRLAGVLAREGSGPSGTADIAVLGAARAPEGFDARFSALSRTYTYRICDCIAERDPVGRANVLWLDESLDVQAMNEAAGPLLGEHDFLAFCRPREGATTIRHLYELRAERERAGLIVIRARADAFCHSMVRTLVGSLMRVGSGARPVSWPGKRLAAAQRNGEVVVAPPHPLTLEEITYPDDAQLAERARLTRAVRRACCGEEGEGI